MNIWRFFLIFITLSICVNLEASSLSEVEIKTKVSAFFPSSKSIRRFFSTVMPYYEFEIVKSFPNNWQAWLGIEYLSNTGHAIGGCKNKTNFFMTPLTLGLKYLYYVNPSLNFYTGAGFCLSFFRNKDRSSFFHKHIFNESLGGIYQKGFIYRFKEFVSIDVFSQYLYQYFFIIITKITTP